MIKNQTPYDLERARERQRAGAARGGSNVPPEKRPYYRDRKLASEAGRKGGIASGVSRRKVCDCGDNPNGPLRQAINCPRHGKV